MDTDADADTHTHMDMDMDMDMEALEMRGAWLGVGSWRGDDRAYTVATRRLHVGSWRWFSLAAAVMRGWRGSGAARAARAPS